MTLSPHYDSTPQLLNRVRMRQVALMLAIEETGTLRAASGHVGLTQPAATKMLHELERAMGQPLFDRVGRGLQVNAAGERVMDYFRGIRGSMESLNRDLRELREGTKGKRDFVGIDLSQESVPDATTLLEFRHLLLANDLTKALFDQINAHLAAQGLLMRAGTIVDAAIKRDAEFDQERRPCTRPGYAPDQEGQRLAIRDEDSHRRRH